MSTIKLTAEQMTQIRTDMDQTVEMLSDEQVHALAQRVNEMINLPFLDEQKELIVFTKIIRWIDRTLYKLLPNEFYELVRDSHDGISREEAIKIEQRTVPLLNKLINVPVLSEEQEGKLISIVVGLIVNAMVKDKQLDSSALNQTQ